MYDFTPRVKRDQVYIDDFRLAAVQLRPFHYQHIECIRCQAQVSLFTLCCSQIIDLADALAVSYLNIEHFHSCLSRLTSTWRCSAHAYIYLMHKEKTFLCNYRPIVIMLSAHSAERPFLNLAPSRAGGEFTDTICIWLRRQIISRLSRRQWQLLSGASFPFYYGIWQGAGPTPQSCSFVVL